MGAYVMADDQVRRRVAFDQVANALQLAVVVAVNCNRHQKRRAALTRAVVTLKVPGKHGVESSHTLISTGGGRGSPYECAIRAPCQRFQSQPATDSTRVRVILAAEPPPQVALLRHDDELLHD